MTEPDKEPAREPAEASAEKLAGVRAWFDAKGWAPFPFQENAWRAFERGASGLIHAPTGFGKTLSAWMGPVAAAMGDPRALRRPKKRADAPPIQVLWITPMRALAQDLTAHLAEVATDLVPGWLVEVRTGDSTSTERARQKRQLPTALVTTPESASLMLSQPDAAERFSSLRAIVVDEWHELLGSKRGTQTELLLARLRGLAPDAVTWGLSATLGNLDHALTALLGPGHRGELISGPAPEKLSFSTLAPPSVGHFPWAGHLGLHLLDEVAEALDGARSSIIFVNTRSQAERWFQALSYARYERRDEIGVHHGSLDREARTAVERGIADGSLWATVATSSLDLGVDFAPVDQVLQVGSPKGIGRLLQRAGRSGHGPGRQSRLIGVPTHALELVEFEAARRAMEAGRLEPRVALDRPLDVLAQHIVTVALGGGFVESELLDEVRSTAAFASLTDEEWSWTMDFCQFGGPALRIYERYARIRLQAGRWVGGSKRVALDHRSSIGTITSFAAIPVYLRNGTHLGSLEEMFLGRLERGEAFTFAGRSVELVRMESGKAVVRPAKAKSGPVARWMGGRMPLSTALAASIQETLHSVSDAGAQLPPSLEPAAELIALQRRSSRVPKSGELLIERVKTRDGDHAFLFPVAGRLVHDGLAALLSYRITKGHKATIGSTCNDWGFSLATRAQLPVEDSEWAALLSRENLIEDILACLDSSGLARRHFREIARVSGLVSSGPPHQRKNQRQLQASAGLVFDVLTEHDQGNLLLVQAKREVLERSMEYERLLRTMEDLQGREVVVTRPKSLTPFAFPLWADRIRERVSSESWKDRVLAMVQTLEKKEGAAALKESPK